MTSIESTKVQNPWRILHILRTMPMCMRGNCARLTYSPPCVVATKGFGQKLYTCELFIINGLGHTMWSLKMLVSARGCQGLIIWFNFFIMVILNNVHMFWEMV